MSHTAAPEAAPKPVVRRPLGAPADPELLRQVQRVLLGGEEGRVEVAGFSSSI